MSTKSRHTIYGGPIMGAKIRAEGARKRAAEAVREADRTAAEAWSLQMEAYGGPAQPSPTITSAPAVFLLYHRKCHRTVSIGSYQTGERPGREASFALVAAGEALKRLGGSQARQLSLAFIRRRDL